MLVCPVLDVPLALDVLEVVGRLPELGVGTSVVRQVAAVVLELKFDVPVRGSGATGPQPGSAIISAAAATFEALEALLEVST